MTQPERCGDKFKLRHGYFCELPKGHEGAHGATWPNPQYYQVWPNSPAQRAAEPTLKQEIHALRQWIKEQGLTLPDDWQEQLREIRNGPEDVPKGETDGVELAGNHDAIGAPVGNSKDILSPQTIGTQKGERNDRWTYGNNCHTDDSLSAIGTHTLSSGAQAVVPKGQTNGNTVGSDYVASGSANSSVPNDSQAVGASPLTAEQFVTKFWEENGHGILQYSALVEMCKAYAKDLQEQLRQAKEECDLFKRRWYSSCECRDNLAKGLEKTQAEVQRLLLADGQRVKDISNLTMERDQARDELARFKALDQFLPEHYAIGDDATAELALECVALQREAQRLTQERDAKDKQLAMLYADFEKRNREYSALQSRLDAATKLVNLWENEQMDFPRVEIGQAVAAAIKRCCAKELRAALAPSEPQSSKSDGG